MANVPGATNVLPGVITNVITQSSAASVPGGTRIAAIIGQGARSEIIIASANGGGKDGLNPAYTSTTGSDGRHFTLNFPPVVPNRAQLFKNGVPLIGLEETIDANPFSDVYDYRIDITNGHIELQTAHLVDQGGSFYSKGVTNVGDGYLQNLELTDVNAPTETWTIKCVSVQRNNINQPVPGSARFVAFGSVSGNVVDVNGNTIVWVSNSTVATNGILSFSIGETGFPASLSPFREGDYFTVQVSSGVLTRSNSLTATYIAVADINNPIFQNAMTNIVQNYGAVSLSNTLSLGCQLAFANQTPGIMCLEAAPPLPRRISYQLEKNFPGASINCDDFIIPLPLGVSPDPNSAIHIFVTNPSTGIETQILPNQFPFYTLGVGSNPSICAFVMDNVNPPAGNSYSYSVVQQAATVHFAQDGYLSSIFTSPTLAHFSSASVKFDLVNVGQTITIIDSANLANIGSFTITSVSGGVATVLAAGTPPFADFINEGSAAFHLVDSVTGATVPGTTGTLVIVASGSTATATVTSSIDLTSFDPVVNEYQLRITSATNASNVGLFDVTAFTPTSTMTIAKSFVSEHSLKFEVIDSSQTSDYLVLNHKVVPDGNSLRVTVVDVKDAPFFDAGWETALATLETQEIDILVTLPTQTFSVIFENALNHCLEMSNLVNRKERVLFLGAINGLTPANLTGAQLAAVENLGVLEGIQGNTVAEILAGNTEDLTNYSVSNAYGETYRAVYFFPDQIVVQVGSDNQIIDGFYIAAAAAGYMSGQTNVAVPLTNKVLGGFTILQNRMFNQLTYESLAQAGVSSLSPVSGGGNVLWGLTTTQSGFPEEQEISIVFIRDRIAKSMRKSFAGYIGNPEDSDTQGTLMARAVSMLNSFISQKLITNFANLSVKRDGVEPRQWDISVLVQPTYPINWIYITVGVGTI